MQRFRSAGALQLFVSVFSAVRNPFVPTHLKQTAIAVLLHRLKGERTLEGSGLDSRMIAPCPYCALGPINLTSPAERVAQNTLGANLPNFPRPWFWPDQYATKLQIAVLNRGYDPTTVAMSADHNNMTVSYLSGDRLVAVDCLNDARSFMRAKRQVNL